MILRITSLLFFLQITQVFSAQVVFDWWEPVQIQDGSFSWSDNQGFSKAELQAFEISEGLAFPGFPQSRFLDEPFWNPSLPVTEQAGVSALDFRVAPIAGNASYSVDISWTVSEDIYVLLGQLFANSEGATSGVQFTNLSPTTEIDLQGTFSWSNSFDDFSENLIWNSTSNTLSPSPLNDGESAFALFRISGGNSSTITIPSSFATGTGDTISIAFGSFSSIPEPKTLPILSIIFLFLFSKRTRRTTN